MTELKDYFARHDGAALAFSGGVDSSYLLYAASECGARLRPYYVKSQFQPEFEYRDALRLCESLKIEPTVIKLDVLACEAVAANPPDRCYHCKRQIMGAIKARAAVDGYSVIFDGTNASDDSSDRPGMRALGELQILSPLRECGLTKADIRRLSKEAGLFTWNKPAYACLATRVRTGERISAEKLGKIEASEDYLFSLGFSDFRVRVCDNAATLQFTARQTARAHELFGEISARLSGYYGSVAFDPKPRGETV